MIVTEPWAWSTIRHGLLGLDGVEAVSVELHEERNPLIALVTAVGEG